MKFKWLLISLVILFTGISVSQSQSLTLNNTYIACGGQFGDPSDHVAVGYIDPDEQVYHTFDSVYNQSVQDIFIDDQYIFVTAGDSLVSYDKETHQRVSVYAREGLNKLAVAGSKLLVSLQYPVTTESFLVLDKHTLSVNTVVELSGEASGIVVRNDSAYVAVPGAWGTAEGKMAVIDLPAETLSREINFGSEARGLKELFLRDDKIYTVNTHFSDYESNTYSVSTFDIFSDSFETDVIEGDYYGYYGNPVIGETRLYIPVSAGIATYELLTGESNPDYMNISPAAISYDKATDRLHITTSDYTTYGNYQLYAINGEPLSGEISVGVSPEAMALDYEVVTATYNMGSEKGKAYISGNILVIEALQSIRRVSVFNASGQQLMRKRVVNEEEVHLQAASLPKGLLLIRVETADNIFTHKIIR